VIGPAPIDTLCVVGSLRRESHTRRLAQALAASASNRLRLDIADIGRLPLYNEDLETQPPLEWIEFRARVRRADAVMFVTPEYNRSIPGVLKNAIDVASRPYGSNVWARKPAAVASASPGSMGAFGANHHLRQCLVFLDMPTLQQPEMYLSGVDKLVDSDGKFMNPSVQTFSAAFMSAFELWIAQNLAARERREDKRDSA
jgi:chromate reductase